MIDREHLATQLTEAMRVDPAGKHLATSRHLGVVKALGVLARTFAGHIDRQERQIADLTAQLEKVERKA